VEVNVGTKREKKRAKKALELYLFTPTQTNLIRLETNLNLPQIKKRLLNSTSFK
jgi:hypothetical protein